MKKFSALAIVSLVCAGTAHPQGRPLDWSSFGGDAQRTGWEKSDTRITKENVKDFQLVLKRKLDNKQAGPRSLTPPVVMGLLISYKGFKELAFVAGSSDNMWAIDADVDKIFWQRRFDYSSDKSKPAPTAACPGGLTAIPSLTPPINFSAARPRTGAAAPAAAAPGGPRGILGGSGFGQPRPAFAVSSDGKLHVINTSTGEDVAPAMPFIPANAKASTLTVLDGVIYTTTSSSCGGAPNGVWAIDLNGAEPKVASYEVSGGDIAGLGGLALGTDGTVYVQTSAGAVLALSPKDLKLKNSFTASGSGPNPATPLVFTWKDRDLIASAGPDGRLYLLDSQSLGGEDHKTPLSQTEPQRISGSLATWQDQDETRWVLAPVNNAIAAFKVEEVNGKPVLNRAWVSSEISLPSAPVTTTGIVFALSTGKQTHSTLHALDAATGKELYSTGNQIKGVASQTGLTIANGRVYFTTTDNTLYAFGIFLER